jgi:hypothetical protein
VKPLPTVEQNPASNLISEIAPAVERAATKMAKAYFVRLSKGGVIQTCDLKNIAWVKVIGNLESIAQKPAGDERAKYAYTIAANAIRDEFRYISTGGDGAESLSHNGTLSRGKDTSYDGGSNVFGGGEDVAPTVVQPAEECWAPPTIWDAWPRLDLERRYKLLEMAGLRGATVLQRDGVRRSCAAAKWNEIPYDYQIEIESAWKQTARGELRKNKHANGAKPRNAFGFVSGALPAPDELAAITPPRLRATALLVHRAGYFTEGDDGSINSGEIAKILGRSARTIHRDNIELLKLWGDYTRASIDEKRDEEKFPRYPLHADVAREFESIPDGAQMPDGKQSVLASAMMAPGRLRSLRLRMNKFHTDFSDAVVTATIVTPRANIYECGPQPSAFKIIAGFKDSIAASEGHSGTIDAQWDYNTHRWVPVRLATGEKCKVVAAPTVKVPRQPYVWGHDWSGTGIADIMGNAPERLYLTTQRKTCNPMFPRDVEDRKPAWCNCALCQTMRRLDTLEGDYHDAELRLAWGSLKPYSTIEDHPLRRSPLRVGILHGFDTAVGDSRIRRTHFAMGVGNGVELWTVEDFGKVREVLTGQGGLFTSRIFPLARPTDAVRIIAAIPESSRPLYEGWHGRANTFVRGHRACERHTYHRPHNGDLIIRLAPDDARWLGLSWLVDDTKVKLLLDGSVVSKQDRTHPWIAAPIVEHMSAEEIANVWYKKRRYWLDRVKAVRASEARSEKMRADFANCIYELWETGSVELVVEGAKIVVASETECSAFELLIGGTK